MTPRPESRISSLEKRATAIEATVEELSSDTAEELKAIRQDNKVLFEHMQKGFEQAHAYIKENIETRLDVMATKEDISKLRDEMKSDITELKESLLDAIKELWQQRPGDEK